MHSVDYEQIFPLKSKNVGKILVSGCPLVFSFKGWNINLYSGQGSTLRGVLESETPSLPPQTPRVCRLAVRRTP